MHEVQIAPVDMGGQAHVFKGSLKDGREVAIKRFNIAKREGLKWAKVKQIWSSLLKSFLRAS